MKVWTLDTDDGTRLVSVFFTAEKAAKAYKAWVEESWERWFGNGPMSPPLPEDPQRAFDILTEQTGYFDSIIMTEHDLTQHPAVREAVATLHHVRERLVMGNLEGEEDGPIEDIDTALKELTT